MGAPITYSYLVRPTTDLSNRFPGAWFARPHVWDAPEHVSPHPRSTDLRCRARIKLAMWATLHAEAAEDGAARDAARALLASIPALTVGAFDRLWVIEEEMGYARVVDPDRLPLASLAAVLPAQDADVIVPHPLGPPPVREPYSLRADWQREIARRPGLEATCITSLVACARKIAEVYPDETATRGIGASCSVPPIPASRIMDALHGDGWSDEGDPKVFLYVARVYLPRVELRFTIRTRQKGRRWRRLRGGDLIVSLAGSEGTPEVESLVLVTEDRRSL